MYFYSRECPLKPFHLIINHIPVMKIVRIHFSIVMNPIYYHSILLESQIWPDLYNTRTHPHRTEEGLIKMCGCVRKKCHRVKKVSYLKWYVPSTCPKPLPATTQIPVASSNSVQYIASGVIPRFWKCEYSTSKESAQWAVISYTLEWPCQSIYN